MADNDHDLLVRMDEKLTQALSGQKDHEGRIRHLERTIWLFSGAAFAGGTSGGAIVAKIIGA
jgi:hypothetical protein